MYVGCGIAFSRGGPYRTPLYRNYALFAAILILLGHFLYITLYPDLWIQVRNGISGEGEDFIIFMYIMALIYFLLKGKMHDRGTTIICSLGKVNYI